MVCIVHIGRLHLKYGFLRLAYGALLIAVLFVPFGFFHSMTEPYVSGVVWGFMLPIGYVAAASGVAVILYPRSVLLRRLGIGYMLILVGVSMLLSIWLFPKELSINLLYGTRMIDTDYLTFNGVVVLLSLFSILAGIAFRLTRITWQTEARAGVESNDNGIALKRFDVAVMNFRGDNQLMRV